MSIISALFNNKACNYEDAFRAVDITTTDMKMAILEWYDLFFRDRPTKDEDPSQRIAYTVVNKLAKTAFSEYTAQSDDEFTDRVMESLNKHKVKALHAGMTGGRAFIKPYPGPNGIEFSVITRPALLIFGKDDQGRPIDVGTAEKTTIGKGYYTLLERRTLQDGKLTIRNMLYRSSSDETIGSKVSLSSLPQYADLPDEYTFSEPIGLGLAEIKCPVPNCVDDSDDPVAVYAAAAGLIHNINRNEAQINGEFERGESRIIVSSDMLERDSTGRKVMRDNVFVGLDDNPEDVGITIFSPTLRESSFLARKTEYLRNVESLIGLKRGILSEVEAAERTAKEVTSSEGDYSLTIIDIQSMWEKAAREACVLAGTIGKLYRVPGAHDINPDDIVIDWGNGVLYDEEKTWQEYKDMVASGMLKPEIALGWKFSMPTDTPEQLAEIRAKYMPELNTIMGGVV